MRKVVDCRRWFNMLRPLHKIKSRSHLIRQYSKSANESDKDAKQPEAANPYGYTIRNPFHDRTDQLEKDHKEGNEIDLSDQERRRYSNKSINETDLFAFRSSADAVGITGLSHTSFQINGNLNIYGAIICTPKHYFLWRVADFHELNSSAFRILDVINPTPRTIVIGMGDEAYKFPDRSILEDYEDRLGCSFEVLSTKEAVHAFNVMNAENRDVMAFLLPMKRIDHDQLDPEINPEFFNSYLDSIAKRQEKKLEKQREDIENRNAKRGARVDAILAAREAEKED
mmetsp:Transcript_5752/g.8474  ORF Transcript_5752/g.8474 Transcript_5752/m.8474 type:complete len:284 (+) Transcript_5752:26-877(+)